MTLDIIVEQLSVYILVFCRIGGMIFFNPLLSRQNIPTQFNIALVMGLTVLSAPLITAGDLSVMTDMQFIWLMLTELFVGFCCGFIFQIFYYLIFAAGDIIDLGFGLAMAKAFDPTTNLQISMSGNIFQLIFVLYFFITNSHLVFINIIISSFDIVELGGVFIGPAVYSFIITLFASAFLLVMQLALPFITAAFVLEMSMGILMKIVPQINVFSINFQFKIMFGLLLMFLFAAPTSEFLLKYMNNMISTIQNVFSSF